MANGICPRCKINPSIDFRYCTSCAKEYAKEYGQIHRVKRNNQQRLRRAGIVAPKRERKPARVYWLKKYGLTEEQFEQMFTDQNECCKICGCYLEFSKFTHIDHNHKTGKLRSILCVNCNSILGFADDDIELLQKVIEYLKEHDARKKGDIV